MLEVIEYFKFMIVDDKMYYEKMIVDMEEVNGLICMLILKVEVKFIYELELYFFYVLENDGVFYFFEDNDVFGILILGSGYLLENVKKVYEIIKSLVWVNL